MFNDSNTSPYHNKNSHYTIFQFPFSSILSRYLSKVQTNRFATQVMTVTPLLSKHTVLRAVVYIENAIAYKSLFHR